MGVKFISMLLFFFKKRRSNLRRVHTTGRVELFNFSLNKTMLKLRINTLGNTKKKVSDGLFINASASKA